MNAMEAQVGHVFLTDTETLDGKPNFAVCVGRKGSITPGFYAHFVDIDDFRRKRLPTDHDFFVTPEQFENWKWAGEYNNPYGVRFEDRGAYDWSTG